MNELKTESHQTQNDRRPVAYCRVSTAHQGTGLAAQIRQVREHCKIVGIEGIEIFTDENQSGAKASRPGLDKMMKEVKAGRVSMVIVPSFSRLARSTTHLLKALDEFKEYDVNFISLSERLDTNSAAGKMAFTVLAAVSQLERELIIERVKVGLANARAKGIHIGRKKTRPSDLIRKLRAAGFTYRKIAEVAKCSHGAVAAELREWEKEKTKELAKELAPDVVAEEEKKVSQTQPEIEEPEEEALEIVRFW